MSDWKTRLAADPNILCSKPIVKGTRISVELILDVLASGWTLDQVTDAYPSVTREDVLAAIAFAPEVFRDARSIAVARLSP